MSEDANVDYMMRLLGEVSELQELNKALEAEVERLQELVRSMVLSHPDVHVKTAINGSPTGVVEAMRVSEEIARLRAALERVRPCLFKEHRDIVDAALAGGEEGGEGLNR